jgi:DNA-binding transcriptional LysR family regulator
MQKSSTVETVDEFDHQAQNLNLYAARTFVAICETGSFRGAAGRVHLSPSAVSLQIAKLETQLGAHLLHRNARGVQLTEHGEILLGFARQLLSLNDETVAAFQGRQLNGRFRLAATHDLGVNFVPRILCRLADLHPNIGVEVRLDSRASVQRLFDEGLVNLALTNETTAPRANAQQLSSEPLVWMMQRGGQAITRDPLPLAVADVGCAWRDAALDGLARNNIDYRIAYLSDTSAGQVAAVRADLAVSALPLAWSQDNLGEVPADHNLPPLGNTQVHLQHDGSEIATVVAGLAGRSERSDRRLI